MAELDVSVDTEQLARLCGEFGEILHELNGTLYAVKKNMNALNETWEGKNHQRFVAKFEEDHAQMQQTLSPLEAYLGELQAAQRKYQKCQSDVHTLVQKLR